MPSTERRIVLIAVLVCGFAVGMAGLLNYFKYRTTANRVVAERLIVTGKSVETSIQSSLALGLHFSDIGTLTGTLERERSTDTLILGIDIFDTDGNMLYSTDRLRSGRPVPDDWLAAARRAGDGNWSADHGGEAAAGISIKNNFGLTIGYLAVRYSTARVEFAARSVAAELALSGLVVFVISASLASLALMGVMRRLDRGVIAIEGAMKASDPVRASASAKGPFGAALRRYAQTTSEAEKELALLQAQLRRGAQP
jgi:hypothetical protein